jgi:hypothetical protein
MVRGRDQRASSGLTGPATACPVREFRSELPRLLHWLSCFPSRSSFPLLMRPRRWMNAYAQSGQQSTLRKS